MKLSKLVNALLKVSFWKTGVVNVLFSLKTKKMVVLFKFQNKFDITILMICSINSRNCVYE